MKWKMEERHVGMTIQAFLTDIAQFSKRLIIKAKSAEGNILVNGKHATVRYLLLMDDHLEVELPEEKIGDKMKRVEMELHIVYEDDFLLVLDKPAGVATIPSRHHPTGTLANGILYYYEQRKLPYTVHVVTRLDRDTTGLVLIAKHQYSHSLLDRMLRGKGIERKYQALVHGEMSEANGMIDLPIGRKEGSIIERVVTEKGQRAVTHYHVKRNLQDITLVDIGLETGRTHQIRVHFAALGHPLLGDDLYGGKKEVIGRQALHCACLAFTHPLTKESLVFHAALPGDMAWVI